MASMTVGQMRAVARATGATGDPAYDGAVHRPKEVPVSIDTKSTSTDDRTAPAGAVAEDTAGPAEALLDEELLVEEVSIDGMCGVY